MPKRYTKKTPNFICLCIAILLCICANFYSPAADVHVSTPQSRRGRKSLFEIPINFGKTHFIVGLSKEDVEAARANQTQYSITENNCGLDEVYFSPDDDLQQKLITYIDNEQEAIWVAIFSFTDMHIAQALLRAKERGVDVQVIVDPGFMTDRYTKIDMLYEHGVPVYIYDPKRSRSRGTLSNIMHHKFVIFFKNVDGRALVWTGSFNFTKSARKSNQENAAVLSSGRIIARYKEKFEQIKENGTIRAEMHVFARGRFGR